MKDLENCFFYKELLFYIVPHLKNDATALSLSKWLQRTNASLSLYWMPLSHGLNINFNLQTLADTRNPYLFCMDYNYKFLFWCLQMHMNAVCVYVCASSSSSSPFIPSVLTFSPNEAATFGSHVSCHEQSVHWTLAGKCSLPGSDGIINSIPVLIY